jgi:hypothetical protein
VAYSRLARVFDFAGESQGLMVVILNSCHYNAIQMVTPPHLPTIAINASSIITTIAVRTTVRCS